MNFQISSFKSAKIKEKQCKSCIGVPAENRTQTSAKRSFRHYSPESRFLHLTPWRTFYLRAWSTFFHLSMAAQVSGRARGSGGCGRLRRRRSGGEPPGTFSHAWGCSGRPKVGQVGLAARTGETPVAAPVATAIRRPW